MKTLIKFILSIETILSLAMLLLCAVLVSDGLIVQKYIWAWACIAFVSIFTIILWDEQDGNQ